MSKRHSRRQFVQAVAAAICVAPVEAGARTATIIHLGNRAYWSGRRFKWDPKTWRFVDDDEANREFLDGERRAPWRPLFRSHRRFFNRRSGRLRHRDGIKTMAHYPY